MDSSLLDVTYLGNVVTSKCAIKLSNKGYKAKLLSNRKQFEFEVWPMKNIYFDKSQSNYQTKVTSPSFWVTESNLNLKSDLWKTVILTKVGYDFPMYFSREGIMFLIRNFVVRVVVWFANELSHVLFRYPFFYCSHLLKSSWNPFLGLYLWNLVLDFLL